MNVYKVIYKAGSWSDGNVTHIAAISYGCAEKAMNEKFPYSTLTIRSIELLGDVTIAEKSQCTPTK